MSSQNRYRLEQEEDWREWARKMPAIKFKADWEVKVIPPFAGAMARFWIDCGGSHVSVYLDVNDALGSVGEPYWEIYPYEDDTCRVLMNNTEELVERISEALKSPLANGKQEG